MALTPNMNLNEPDVSVTSGPDWATDLNSCLTLIDAHDHTPGNGVQIPAGGINIQSSLTLNSNSLIGIAALTLVAQSVPPTSASIYRSSNDLYFVDGVGNNVRITQGGSVAGSSGTITGLPSGTASAAFAAGTFTFQSATATGANIDGASYVLRNNTANSKGLTLAPPNAMGADYGLTLPAIPAAASFMSIDTSGNMSATIATAQGITASNIANATITGTQVASGISLPGNNVRANSKQVLVQNASSANNLAIVRGTVISNGTRTGGEGFTVVQNSTGRYTITYSPALNDAASVAINIDAASAKIVTVTASTAVGFEARTFDLAGNPSDQGFQFIAIGQYT